MNHKQPSTALQASSDGVRQAVFARVAQHIRDDHQATEGTCWTDRMGLIAFLMHSLALTVDDCERLKPFVESYDIDCPCQPDELFSPEVIATKDAAVEAARQDLASLSKLRRTTYAG